MDDRETGIWDGEDPTRAGTHLPRRRRTFLTGGVQAPARRTTGVRDGQPTTGWRRTTNHGDRSRQTNRDPRAHERAAESYEAGMTLQKMGFVEDAISAFEQIPQGAALWAAANMRLAELYRKAGRDDDVGPALREALAVARPTDRNLDRFEQLAQWLVDQGRSDSAMDLAHRVAQAGLRSPVMDRMQQHHGGYAPPQRAEPVHAGAPARPGRGGRNRDRWQLGRLLGEGGTGNVYEAFDRALQTRVALKCLRPELFGDNRVRQLFVDEAKMSCRLTHPGITRVYDVEVDETVRIVMELLEGSSLRELLDKAGGRAPWPFTLRMVAPLCGALDYAHRRKVVHRDIKPDNVMITSDGHVKLLDFGIAHAWDAHCDPTVLFAGTPTYMSPEQCTTGKVDGRSDQYSLACMIFEVLVGRPPFQGRDVIVKHREAQPPNIEHYVRGIPEGLGAVLLKAMAKKPADRHETCGDLLRALCAL